MNQQTIINQSINLIQLSCTYIKRPYASAQTGILGKAILVTRLQGSKITVGNYVVVVVVTCIVVYASVNQLVSFWGILRSRVLTVTRTVYTGERLIKTGCLSIADIQH